MANAPNLDELLSASEVIELRRLWKESMIAQLRAGKSIDYTSLVNADELIKEYKVRCVEGGVLTYV